MSFVLDPSKTIIEIRREMKANLMKELPFVSEKEIEKKVERMTRWLACPMRDNERIDMGQCLLCHYGHMLNCHYPYECYQVKCTTYQQRPENRFTPHRLPAQIALEFYKRIDESRKKCRVCGTILPIEIYAYEHADGWVVEGLELPQWLYIKCPNPKCHNEWSLDKLGVPADSTEG